MTVDVKRSTLKVKISLMLNIAIVTVFTIAAIATIVLVKHNFRRQALVEAEAKARIIFDRNLATHTFFSHILKPNLFKFTAPFRTGQSTPETNHEKDLDS
jgi:hypothetical protein